MIPAKFDSLLPRLISTAMDTDNNDKLCAVLIHGSKMLSRPVCNNNDRGVCRGNSSGSHHAEVSAMTNYFGKYLSYSNKLGWCLL